MCVAVRILRSQSDVSGEEGSVSSWWWPDLVPEATAVGTRKPPTALAGGAHGALVLTADAQCEQLGLSGAERVKKRTVFRPDSPN